MKGTFALSAVAIIVVLLLITGIEASIFSTPAYAPEPRRIGSPSLTGVWQSNDGGTYYLRQIGDTLWWNGMSGGNDGRTYNNVFKGTITYQTFPYTILGEWADVPRGTNMGAGTMTLKMESYTTLLEISQSGGFGPILWVKVR